MSDLTPRNYHVLLAVHPVNGDDINNYLCSWFKRKPGAKQDKYDQSRTYVLVDCSRIEDFAASHPDLTAFIPPSYPSWITDVMSDPMNGTLEEAKALVRTTGNVGEAWQAPSEV